MNFNYIAPSNMYMFMNRKRWVSLLFFILLWFNSEAQLFSSPGDTIPDDGTTIDFQIVVSGLPTSIDTAFFGLEAVCITLTHTWDSDLDISLVAPDGTVILLTSANGGDGDDYFSCFKATASLSIVQGTPPFSGFYRPQGQMGRVNNLQNPNSTWYLRIHDTYPFADWGILNNWILIFGNSPATYQPFSSSDIPLVLINTNNQPIAFGPKTIVHMGIIDNGIGQRNYVSDSLNIYNGMAAIEIRGHSSSSFPQKQFHFETRDSLGNDSDVVLLGMPAEHDWILYAPYTDKSLIRNRLTYKLANESGHYAVKGRFVELLIDDQYQGVYELTETIKRDANRVDIAKLTPADTAGNELTGGYIVKIDWVDGPFWTSMYPPDPTAPANNVINFQTVYPKPDVILQVQQNYIDLYIDSFEISLKSPLYTDPLTGWRKYADENSFIDFFILNELGKNVDAYRLSTYFYKDKASNGGKLHMGPVWDFNLAWHNADYCGSDLTSGWAYRITDYCQADIPFWWKRLMTDNQFKNNLHCRWNDLRQNILDTVSLFNYIDSTANYLQESQVRHFDQWPIIGVYVWPNPAPLATSYAGEIDNLKTWIAARISWMDANLPGSCIVAGLENIYIPEFSIYPNPATNHALINVFYKFSERAELNIYNPTGELLYAKSVLNSVEGSVTFNVDVSNLTPGIYILRIKDGDKEIPGCKKLVVQ